MLKERVGALEFLSLLVFLFAILFFGIFLKHSPYSSWSKIAGELKLKHVPSKFLSPEYIEGSYKGFDVRVETYRKRQREKHNIYTKISTRFNKPLPKGLRIYATTLFLSDIGEFLGCQDIKTESPKFNDLFVIKGEREDEVLQLLTYSIRDVLVRYHDRFTLEMNAHEVSYQWSNIIRQTNQLRAVLDAQHEIAKALCAPPQAPSHEVG